jgi:hypothetical protein
VAGEGIVARDPRAGRAALLPALAIYAMGAAGLAFLSPAVQPDPLLFVIDLFGGAALAGGAFFAARGALKTPLREALVAVLVISVVRAAGLGLLKLLRPDLVLTPLAPGRLALTLSVFAALGLAGSALGRLSGGVAVFANETAAVFRSSSTYFTLAAFSALAGVINLGGVPSSLGDVLARTGTLMLFGAPMFALRYAAVLEGRAPDPYHGAPVHSGGILVARYFASLLPGLTLLAATLPVPLALAGAGRVGLGPLVTGYLGLALLTAAATAVGFFAAAVSPNPVVAAGTVVALALLCFALGGQVGGMEPGTARTTLEWLAATQPLGTFARGVIEARHVAYYAGLAAVALLWTRRWAEGRRWR